MPWDDLERSARPVDEVLPGVLARGRHLRRRHRIAVRAVGSLAVVICMVGFAAAAASTGGPGHRRVVAATGRPATSMPEDATTSSSPSTVPTPAATPTTVAVRHRAPTTTTTLYCHNSKDPRCGPFHWVGDPGPNYPATDVVKWTPEVPQVGQDVTFTMTWDDPDAPILNSSMNLCIADRRSACVSGTTLLECDRYGAWDLPAREPFHLQQTMHHTFTEAGVFRLGNEFITTANYCPAEFDPYGSRGEFSGEITVVPAPTTTTTTTTTR